MRIDKYYILYVRYILYIICACVGVAGCTPYLLWASVGGGGVTSQRIFPKFPQNEAASGFKWEMASAK